MSRVLSRPASRLGALTLACVATAAVALPSGAQAFNPQPDPPRILDGVARLLPPDICHAVSFLFPPDPCRSSGPATG